MDNHRLTQEVIQVLYNKLLQNCENDSESDCIIFTGPIQNGYGMLRKNIKKHCYRIYAHRVALLHALNLLELPSGLQCSHLCHIKKCVNVAHMSIEPQFVNNNRNNCKDERRCTRDHVNYDGNSLPNCIFS